MQGNRGEFDDFLMRELFSVKEYISEEDEQIFQTVFLFAVYDKHLQETMLNFYLAPLCFPREKVAGYLGLFHGMDLLELICDCQSHLDDCMKMTVNNHNQSINYGRQLKETDSKQYHTIIDEIVDIRLAIAEAN